MRVVKSAGVALLRLDEIRAAARLGQASAVYECIFATAFGDFVRAFNLEVKDGDENYCAFESILV